MFFRKLLPAIHFAKYFASHTVTIFHFEIKFPIQNNILAAKDQPYHHHNIQMSHLPNFWHFINFYFQKSIPRMLRNNISI